MAKFRQLKVDFPIPKILQQDIDALEEGIKNHVSYVDCLQNEVHGSARILDDEEKEKVIIDYYCRYRWWEDD